MRRSSAIQPGESAILAGAASVERWFGQVNRLKASVRKPNRTRTQSRRLRMESLEARRVLATYIVDTNADTSFGICGIDGVGNSDCSLRSAIIAANNNPGTDVIMVPAGTYNLTIANDIANDATEGSLDILDSVSILGMTGVPNDVIINANDLDSVFTVEGIDTVSIDVRFESLTIQGGLTDEEGGGIQSRSFANLEIVNTILQNNRVLNQSFAFAGGAIYSTDSLLIEGSVILNNSVSIDGITVAGVGGGVAHFAEPGSTLVIRDTRFEGNSAEFGGGLFVSGADPALSAVLERVVFDQNVATDEGGGALFEGIEFITITDSEFLANDAQTNGGAVMFLQDSNGTLNPRMVITGTSFRDNLAGQNPLVSGGGGGAIFAGLGTFLEIRDAEFLRNSLPGPGLPSGGASGGAIRIRGGLIEDTEFRENQAAFGSGGGVSFVGEPTDSLTILRTTFVNNSAAETGGGLDAFGDFGGAILLDDVTFDQNTAGLSGGGAYLHLVGSVDIVEGQFLTNTTNEAGGGLYLLDTGPVLISRTIFDGNTANGGGGGGVAILTDTTIEDSLFQNNVVTTVAFAFDEGGGGISIAQDFDFQPTVEIFRSSILDNRAPLGGGIGSANANLTVIDSTIARNQATSDFGGGGGIGFAQDNTLGIVPRVLLTIVGSVIEGNLSNEDAAGIGIADADASIIGTSVLANVAGGRAGGIGIIGSNNSPTLSIQQSTIAMNDAGSDGGGIAVVNAGLQALNVTISNNTSDGFGGGLAYSNNDDSLSTSNIFFSTIASNSTLTGSGSNIASDALPLAFTSSLIADPIGVDAAGTNFLAGPGSISSVSFNIDSDGSGGFTSPGDQSNVDPRIGPLADNGGPVQTRALLAGSPAIDGSDTSPLATDARSFPRLQDGNADGVERNDIGSFEAPELTLVANDDFESVGLDSSVLIAVLDNDTTNIPPLRIVSVSQPTNGTVNIVGDQIQYVANDTFVGDDVFTYTITNSPLGVDTPTQTAFVTVTVDAVNRAPTEILLDSDSVPSDSAIGTVVGIFTTIDPDIGDTHTYTLVTGIGDDDNAAFSIFGDSLLAEQVFDFEVQDSYTIRVRSTDSGGLSTEEIFAITIDAVLRFKPDTPVDATTGVALTIDGNILTSNDIASSLSPAGIVSILSVTGTTAEGGSVTLAEGGSVTLGDLITNPGFEIVPDGANFGQGLMPSDWQDISISADTFSNDGSYGLFPNAFGNFTGVTAHQGIRWVAGGSGGRLQTATTPSSYIFGESFGTMLATPLVSGVDYTLSGFLYQSPKFDVAGGYHVFLAQSGSVNDMPSGVYLGLFAPTTSNSWEAREFTFTAPENSLSMQFLAFSPYQAEDGEMAYPGLDNLSLTAVVGQKLTYISSLGFVGTDTIEYVITDGITSTIATLQVNVSDVDQIDLATSTLTGVSEVAVGDQVFYEVLVDNLSLTPATDVVIVTSVGSLAFIDFASGVPVGNVVIDSFLNTATWTLPSIPPATTFSYTLFATAGAPGLLETTSNASSPAADPDLTNNSSSSEILIVDGVSVELHTLSTGDGDGDIRIDVDAFGRFGTGAFGSSGQSLPVSVASFDPVGPFGPADVVVESMLGIRAGSTGPFESVGPFIPGASITQQIDGSITNATSAFIVGDLRVSLDQSVAQTFLANGSRAGAQLTQAYTILNSSPGPASFDLARFIDADLEFDSSVTTNGGGILIDSTGNIIAFITDSVGTASTDTPFVAITAMGGEPLTNNRFDIDQLSLLEDRLFSSSFASPLRDAVSGDIDGDGFVDASPGYDAAAALRNVFTLLPGQSIVYVTETIFGTRPDSLVPPIASGDLIGRVFCDFNGNGIEDIGEAAAGAFVFIDLNGNRIFDSALGEPFTVTDSQGNYSLFIDNLSPAQRENVVVINPPGCFPNVPEIGVTRTSLTTGSLSRDIATVFNPETGLDELLVINELGNDLYRLNRGAAEEFIVGAITPLGKRPFAISVYQPSGQSPTIAVAALGVGTDPGALFVINDAGISEFPAGNGPIAVVVDDFNGDGQPDFITASFRDGKILARLSGVNDPIVIAEGLVPRSISKADINGDSHLDLVVVTTGFSGDSSSEVIVLLGDGKGGFTALRNSVSRGGAIDVVVGDYNGSGSDEIIIANFAGSVEIFGVNTTTGTLSRQAFLSVDPGITAVAAEDLNSDGILDLVTVNPSIESIEIFIGQIDGSFVKNRTIRGVVTPAALAIGNFDGDSIRDIAVANLFSASNPYRLPSSVTILGLTVTEREVTLSQTQPTTADFGFMQFASTPVPRLSPSEFRPDINRDGVITPLDALLVLNEIGKQRRGIGEGETVRRAAPRYKFDVNGDGVVTPLDALLILNRISRDRRAMLLGAEGLGNDDDNRISAVDQVMAEAMLF